MSRRLFTAIGFAAVSAALAGCSAFHIYNSEKVEQKGILINVKKPVTMHTTQWSVNMLRVQVEITTPDEKTVLGTIPDTALVVPSTAATRYEVNALRVYIDQLSDKEIPSDFNDEVNRHFGLITAAANNDANSGSVGGLLTSNTRTVEAVLAPEQYYYNAKVPLFGSITATVKLGSDGTLTEATANIVDKTAETLLSLFPVKELTSKMFGAREQKSERKRVALKADDRIATVTLKKPVGEGYCADDGALKPLSITDGLRGQNCVQLVSFVTSGGGDKGGPNKKAYTINGTIVPPDDTPAPAPNR